MMYMWADPIKTHLVFINTDITSLMSGDIVSVYIEGSTEYDLIGRLV